MKVTEYRTSPERRVLLGMILSDAVLGRVSAQWGEDGLFASRAANIIGNLCVQYFNRYGRAPGKDIESLCASWAVGKDDNASGEIDDFLRSLDSWEKLSKGLNADLLIDEAGQHFTSVRLQKLFDQGSGFLLKGDVTKAQALWDGYKPLEMGDGGHINPVTDDEALRRVFTQQRDSLIVYPGGLGEFFGRALKREALVAVMASAKRGKSYVLQDIVFRAIEQGRRVAFFECGDLTQDEVMERFMTRITNRPLFLEKNKPSLIYNVPTRMTMQDNTMTLKREKMEITTSLTPRKVMALRDKFRKEYNADDLLRLCVRSSYSLSVPMIRNILSRWAKEGWNCDICVVDYADILKPPLKGTMDKREQTNATWMLLSQMRQDLHCLVVVATQADADSYETELLTREHFTDDRRKNDHVTAMFGLNQTKREKEKGVYRLNWLDLRGQYYSEIECCYAAGCLEIARPFMLSSFRGVEG